MRIRLRAAERPAHGLLRPRPDRARRPRARRRGAPGRCQRERLGQTAWRTRRRCGPTGAMRSASALRQVGGPAQGGRGAYRGGSRRRYARMDGRDVDARDAPYPDVGALARRAGVTASANRDPGGGGLLPIHGALAPRGAVAGARAGQGGAAAALRGGRSARRRTGAGGRAASHGGGRAGGRRLPHAPPLAEGAPALLPAPSGSPGGARSRPRRWRAPATATARVDGRPRAGAPAAGQRQGRDLHDAGGREWDLRTSWSGRTSWRNTAGRCWARGLRWCGARCSAPARSSTWSRPTWRT